MKPSLLPAAPSWAVPVRVPFLWLVLAGFGLRTSWLLASQRARVSPFHQSLIVQQVAASRRVWLSRWWLLCSLPALVRALARP